MLPSLKNWWFAANSWGKTPWSRPFGVRPNSSSSYLFSLISRCAIHLASAKEYWRVGGSVVELIEANGGGARDCEFRDS